MLVVSDTTPLNYLVLTGEVDVLQKLFGCVVIPQSVQNELSAAGAPPAVRAWAGALPDWARVCASVTRPDTELGAGEEEAIALASELYADILLVDERLARTKAQSRGLRVTGTIGVLILAAERGLIDLDSTLTKLQNTSAFLSPHLMSIARETARRLRSSP